MEDQIQQEDLFDVEIDATAKSLISDIAIWAKIVAITAFVSYGLSLVVSIIGRNELDSGLAASSSKASQIAGTLVMVIIGVIINIYLYKFAIDAKHGIDHSDQPRLETAFGNLRIYYKIIGVFVIIILSFGILAILLVSLGR